MSKGLYRIVKELSLNSFADPKVVIETPKRIFAEYPDSPICFCDYSFPDEKLFESKERFQDLLDLHVKEEQLDTASESLPSKYIV